MGQSEGIQTCSAGLDIGGTRIRLALVANQHILWRRDTSWPENVSGEEELDFLLQWTEDCLRTVSAPLHIKSVGIAFAGNVDHAGTVLMWPNRPAWRGIPLRSSFQARLNMPLLIEDDANAAAFGELSFGACKGSQNFLFATAGTGIGAGIILQRTIYRGQHGWAGELGHLVVEPQGPLCTCGRRGCLQAIASGRALDNLAHQCGLESARELGKAAEYGDGWAVYHLVKSGESLGRMIANIVNFLDLEGAVLGGGLSTLSGKWWAALQTHFEMTLSPSLKGAVFLRKSILGDEAGLLGAAALAAEKHSQKTGYPGWDKTTRNALRR
ncbi:MAG TPA: ROK family protein [Ktedonobacteraceae bacterium]|nr:ROK family protein [Ktedonobacteraceae bacterium]